MSGKALNLKYTTCSTQYCANLIGTITEFLEVRIHPPLCMYSVVLRIWWCNHRDRQVVPNLPTCGIGVPLMFRYKATSPPGGANN